MPKGYGRPSTRNEKDAARIVKDPTAPEPHRKWANNRMAERDAKDAKSATRAASDAKTSARMEAAAKDRDRLESHASTRPKAKPPFKAAAASLKSGWRKGAEKYGLTKTRRKPEGKPSTRIEFD